MTEIEHEEVKDTLKEVPLEKHWQKANSLFEFGSISQKSFLYILTSFVDKIERRINADDKQERRRER